MFFWDHLLVNLMNSHLKKAAMFKFVIITLFSVVFIPFSRCINIDVFSVPSTSKQGSPVTLTCSAGSDRNLIGEYLLAWSKNGRFITIKDQLVDPTLNRSDVETLYQVRLSSLNNIIVSDILFQSVHKTDAGVYECGLYGSDPRDGPSVAAASRSGLLDVLYYPSKPFPLCQPRYVRYHLRYHRPVTLVCTSEIGNPPIQFLWSKTTNDQKSSKTLLAIERLGNNTISSELTLNDSIIGNQNSVFTCMTINSESFPESGSSCSINVNVVIPFRVSIYPNEVRTLVGETANFKCRVQNRMYGRSGTDKDSNSEEDKSGTDIQWSTEPPMMNSSRIIIVDNTLQVKDLREADNGTVVSCYALFEDRWFESRSILYTYLPMEQASPETQGFNTSATRAAWVLGTLLLITVLILTRMILRNRSLTQTDRKLINSESQGQDGYQELEINSVASPKYTDLKIRTNNREAATENNEEYTYIDKPNDQETRLVRTEEVYDYAETERYEMHIGGPKQPKYINKPFKPHPVV